MPKLSKQLIINKVKASKELGMHPVGGGLRGFIHLQIQSSHQLIYCF